MFVFFCSLYCSALDKDRDNASIASILSHYNFNADCLPVLNDYHNSCDSRRYIYPAFLKLAHSVEHQFSLHSSKLSSDDIKNMGIFLLEQRGSLSSRLSADWVDIMKKFPVENVSSSQNDLLSCAIALSRLDPDLEHPFWDTALSTVSTAKELNATSLQLASTALMIYNSLDINKQQSQRGRTISEYLSRICINYAEYSLVQHNIEPYSSNCVGEFFHYASRFCHTNLNINKEFNVAKRLILQRHKSAHRSYHISGSLVKTVKDSETNLKAVIKIMDADYLIKSILECPVENNSLMEEFLDVHFLQAPSPQVSLQNLEKVRKACRDRLREIEFMNDHSKDNSVIEVKEKIHLFPNSLFRQAVADEEALFRNTSSYVKRSIDNLSRFSSFSASFASQWSYAPSIGSSRVFRCEKAADGTKRLVLDHFIDLKAFEKFSTTHFPPSKLEFDSTAQGNTKHQRNKKTKQSIDQVNKDNIIDSSTISSSQLETSDDILFSKQHNNHRQLIRLVDSLLHLPNDDKDYSILSPLYHKVSFSNIIISNKAKLIPFVNPQTKQKEMVQERLLAINDIPEGSLVECYISYVSPYLQITVKPKRIINVKDILKPIPSHLFEKKLSPQDQVQSLPFNPFMSMNGFPPFPSISENGIPPFFMPMVMDPLLFKSSMDITPKVTDGSAGEIEQRERIKKQQDYKIKRKIIKKKKRQLQQEINIANQTKHNEERKAKREARTSAKRETNS